MGRISVLISGILIFTSFLVSAQEGPSSFEFVENKGQWNNSVQYKGELSSGAFFLHKKGFTVALHNPADLARFMATHDPALSDKKAKHIDYSKDLSGKVTDKSITRSTATIRSHAYKVEFTGANENPEAVPEKPTPSFNNYFIGNDPSKWAGNVKIFHAVRYKDIYPNIDLRYYSENGTLKYDLIVNPGGDPSRIAMKYTGVEKLSVKNNELVIKTSVGNVKELYPYSYQSDNVKGRKEIACKYVLSGNNTVRFQIGNYSKNSTLIIDPSLVFSSFTGSSANQYGFTATPGPDGSLFSGGIVFSNGFPVTPGAYQSSFHGGAGELGTDIAIMKFSANGSQRLYATYLGGAENDYPHSLFSDQVGNLVVMGRSYSGDYPGSKVGSCRGANIVVSKLNVTGSGLIGSLIIGGEGPDGVNIRDIQRDQDFGATSLVRNYGDDSRSEVILDAGGNIYVAAQSHSDSFPIRGGGFQNTIGGKQDGVVLKINPTCTSLLWSTYLGGSDDDGAFVLDINPVTGNIYVAGATMSTNFPGNKSGTIGTANNGDVDGYVAILNPGGTSLIRSTYLGTAAVDIVYGLKFDRKGFPYVMGTTRGAWPVINAPYNIPNSAQFIAKLQQDLSAYVYSTVIGTGVRKPNLSPVAFLVDRCENVYMSGWGGWISKGDDPYDLSGVRGMPVTDDAIKKSSDNSDFYFFVLKRDATDRLYGTFFGQTGGDYGEHVDGGTSRYDQQGVIYQAICANCRNNAKFPTTPGVIGPVNGALPDGCNLAAVKISFNFAGVASGPKAYFNNVPDSVGCAPFTVNLRDTVVNAHSYEWNFGDGSPDTTTLTYDISHTFNNVGVYRIRLIAVDSTTCNQRDTAYTTIRVGNDRATLAYDIVKLNPCEALNYRFDNLSTSNSKPFNDSSFTWDFGDGSPRVVTGRNSLNHPYAAPGTYNGMLVLTDTGYCNSPDSIPLQVRVNPLVVAQFETPATGCAPYNAEFVNTSLAGTTFHWDFGDGDTSNLVNPTHLYPTPGTYIIRLVAMDEGTCNKIDDTTFTIVVSEVPTAEFSHTPVVPVQNTPTIFTNLSTGGVRYVWLFGDGDSVVKNTRDTVLHQYNATGTYNACLITINQFGCSDTVCHEVLADILPLLDVPNAFTPGKFGRNSRIKVEGFGIARISFKIYNRLGQKVFETNSRFGAWDGTFNGKPQPVDVYAYTLDVQFSDGTKTRRSGDITLIR